MGVERRKALKAKAGKEGLTQLKVTIPTEKENAPSSTNPTSDSFDKEAWKKVIKEVVPIAKFFASEYHR